MNLTASSSRVPVGLLLSDRQLIQWGFLMLLILIVSPRIGNFRLLPLPMILTLGVMLIYQRLLGQMQVNPRLPILNPHYP